MTPPDRSRQPEAKATPAASRKSTQLWLCAPAAIAADVKPGPVVNRGHVRSWWRRLVRRPYQQPRRVRPCPTNATATVPSKNFFIGPSPSLYCILTILIKVLVRDVGSNSSIDAKCFSPKATCQNGNTQAQSQIALYVHRRAYARADARRGAWPVRGGFMAENRLFCPARWVLLRSDRRVVPPQARTEFCPTRTRVSASEE